MTETLSFKIDCEWLCNFIRQRVYWEGMDFQWGLDTLKASFGSISDEDAFSILTGTKKIVGINGGELVDDNKLQDYLDYVTRAEEKRKKEEFEKHQLMYPLNYIDPFATIHSYKEFSDMHKSKGTIPTLQECKDWFCIQQHDELFEGGVYSLSLADKIIVTEQDKEEFYQKLYLYWKNRLDADISDKDKHRIAIRNRKYELWLQKRTKKTREKLETLIRNGEVIDLLSEEQVKENDRNSFPCWAISKENTYNLCEVSESFYQSSAKYVPLEENEFFGYGLISPDGEFYACTFASHEAAAVVICHQKGYFGKPRDNMSEEEWAEYTISEYRTKAKEILYERGWVFVNSAYGFGGTFYSKWGKLEDMPQKQMDTAFDFDVWERSTSPDDPRRRR